MAVPTITFISDLRDYMLAYNTIVSKAFDTEFEKLSKMTQDANIALDNALAGQNLSEAKAEADRYYTNLKAQADQLVADAQEKQKEVEEERTSLEQDKQILKEEKEKFSSVCSEKEKYLSACEQNIQQRQQEVIDALEDASHSRKVADELIISLNAKQKELDDKLAVIKSLG